MAVAVREARPGPVVAVREARPGPAEAADRQVGPRSLVEVVAAVRLRYNAALRGWLDDPTDRPAAKRVNDAKDLADLAGMLADGRVRPHINRTYSLDGVPEAMAYIQSGAFRGKVAIAI